MKDSGFEVKEVEAKSILSPSRLKDADYDFSCNPYTGCRFGCVYCYASFMARYVGKKTEDWGNFVFAKINAPELLEKEILKMKGLGKGKVIWFSSVTDPYQGLEAKYQLTRKCLEALVKIGYQGSVSFLTKSDLVLRDIDVMKQLKEVEVGMTVTSTDDDISQFFEKHAPPASKRLAALKKLSEEGIKTYAFVGPLLPHFVAKEESLDKLFKALKAVGINDLYVENINLSNYILGRLRQETKGLNSEIMARFYETKDKSNRIKMNQIVKRLVKKYGLKLRMDETLYHQEMN